MNKLERLHVRNLLIIRTKRRNHEQTNLGVSEHFGVGIIVFEVYSVEHASCVAFDFGGCNWSFCEEMIYFLFVFLTVT